jgi:hypothetical protein
LAQIRNFWTQWLTYGDIVEEERPVMLRLDKNTAFVLKSLDQSRWANVEQARQSVLFETPIAHFVVRAFLADGVDESLAYSAMVASQTSMNGSLK